MSEQTRTAPAQLARFLQHTGGAQECARPGSSTVQDLPPGPLPIEGTAHLVHFSLCAGPAYVHHGRRHLRLAPSNTEELRNVQVSPGRGTSRPRNSFQLPNSSQHARAGEGGLPASICQTSDNCGRRSISSDHPMRPKSHPTVPLRSRLHAAAGMRCLCKLRPQWSKSAQLLRAEQPVSLERVTSSPTFADRLPLGHDD